MKTRFSQAGASWWVAISFVALISILGLIVFSMLRPPSESARKQGAAMAESTQKTPLQKPPSSPAVIEYRRNTSYDPWTMRPKVGPPKMPKKINSGRNKPRPCTQAFVTPMPSETVKPNSSTRRIPRRRK